MKNEYEWCNELALSLEEIEILKDYENSFDLGFKIILLGEAGVGKSSILIRSTQDRFDEFYSATIGFEYATLNFEYLKKKIKFQIWDTCGQEIYRALVSTFYKNVSLAILVYSVNKYEKLFISI